ncbi:hypothetical protein [Sphingosinicella sp. CPCC 101087]|uniref:hypothetical protein n=1 Tax=Sphingosinicella sp. CPCC 101087 TaxID=2497754 RepID=UPI00101C1D77|nr:hypothetical protein [Sphingosinicella sp. CPCC 101087]
MIVSLLGLVISLFAYLLAFPQSHQRRFDIYGAILAVHIAGAVGYWLLSFESAMDAFTYYRDPFGYVRKSPFAEGTFFIVHVVQFIRRTLGGSFLDHFLFFQCFGMIGVALLIRSFNEIAESFHMAVPFHVYLLLFLPGLHFWSAGIGKDGPMIMAVSLAAWASLRIHKRIVWMVLSLGIMALIRPHVGAVVMVGVASALLFTKQMSMRAKAVLAPVALMGLLFLAFRASERLGVGFSADSVAEFVEQQQGFGDEYGGGADLASQPFPLKIWALLFRPFFFDTDSWMQRIASIENAVLLYFFAYLAYNWRTLLTLAKNVFYVCYSIVFCGLLIVLLAMVNYNIGLGQRQKMMAVPLVILLYGTVYIYKQYRRREQASMQYQPESLAPAASGVPAKS